MGSGILTILGFLLKLLSSKMSERLHCKEVDEYGFGTSIMEDGRYAVAIVLGGPQPTMCIVQPITALGDACKLFWLGLIGLMFKR